ncbi:inositol hexakisphosphate and diphosphoinositol-pentakisphosphate kinase [Coemansia sp. RSA 1843]|nr:inositol hexakisphosphate and diphosphoinositol-pentakisphosphate kinase [Coemansia sp. RSA 1843]
MFASVLSRSSSVLRTPLASRLLISSVSRRAISATSECAKHEPESAYEPTSSMHAQQHSYLQDLLEADDANAPWHQSPVEMVSREPGTAGIQTMSDHLSTSPHFIDLPQYEGRKPIIGICAMDSKARSKPMTNILNRLVATDRYELVFFGEKTILDEKIEAWPLCDFLISFLSSGFPLEKAFEYSQLRKPFLVNSLVRQFLLLDRRVVLEMLHHIGVPTPFHLVVSRDGGPQIHAVLRRVVEQRMGFTMGSLPMATRAEVVDEDTLMIGSRTIRKPFVEKPCDAEDHNIHIYYASWQGGGVRKLFRKVGNKSSEFIPGPSSIRTDGSFIYEEFVDVSNAVDVKVYTVGREYAHAETRKSPVVDGHVRRNSDGKEMRFVTQLTPKERKYAQDVSAAFGQRVCGFDILRSSNGSSMVMDVNGWSFVKGSEDYYKEAARILDDRFQEALRHRWFARFVDAETVGRITYESRWMLKGVFDVCRHADRTPKQKVKCILDCPPILSLLDGGTSEVILRKQSQLRRTLDALKSAKAGAASESSSERSLLTTVQNLDHLIDVLSRKIEMPGTKVQIKPLKDKSYSSAQGSVSSVQLVLKWGGECTHAGRVQSQDLGENMRKDLLLLNRHLLDDVKIYSSAERRVLSTVASYVGSFLDEPEAQVMEQPGLVEVRSEMLDDSTVAKDDMEVAKSQLREFFNFDGPLKENPYKRLVEEAQNPFASAASPRAFLKQMCDLMCRLIARMEANFRVLSKEDLDRMQDKWCCNETAELFRERWKKILTDFQSVEEGPDGAKQVTYDPGKVGVLYDSLKYDALHNRRFLERIFMTPEKLSTELATMAENDRDLEDNGASSLIRTDDVPATATATIPVPALTVSPVVTPAAYDAQPKPEDEGMDDDDYLEIAPGFGQPAKHLLKKTQQMDTQTRGIPPLPSITRERYQTEKTAAADPWLRSRPSTTTLPSTTMLTALDDSSNNVHGRQREEAREPNSCQNNDADDSQTQCADRNEPYSEDTGPPGSPEHNEPPPEYPPDPLFTQQEVRELYYSAKLLFDFVTWREYGTDAAQRKRIGVQASVPLLQQLISDLEDTQNGDHARTRFYFTKESHIYTLLNLVFLCDIPTMVPFNKMGELDYLTHIIFEVYERKADVDANVGSEYSLRVGLSPGANCFHVLDVAMDPTHALKVLPRRNFSNHTPLNKAIGMLQALLDEQQREESKNSTKHSE